MTVEETYMVFEFEEAELVGQARARIDEWVKTFRIAFGQLKAAEQKQGQSAKLIVRLAFGEHEKFAYERWLNRLPQETPFAQARVRLVRPTDPDFAPLEEQFRRLTEQDHA